MGEVVGGRWGAWEDMDERKRWMESVKDPDEDYAVDLA